MNETMNHRPLQHDGSRRGFLNWFLGTSAGAFLLAVLYPVARYLAPPQLPESSAAAVTLGVKTDDVKPNTGQTFKFGNKPALLIRTANGEMRAFMAVCTHLGCTVQYRPDLGQIWCACHNGHFDLNGKNVSGPPPRPLDGLVVNVRGTQITVTKGA
jgi:Rieske Fe-S protein